MGLGASCSCNKFDTVYGGGGIPFPWTEFVCQCEVTMSVTEPASRPNGSLSGTRPCSARPASVLPSARTCSTARGERPQSVFTDETSFIISAAGQDEVASGTATRHGGRVLRHHHRYAEQSPHGLLLVSNWSRSGPSPLRCGHREICEGIRHHAKHVVAP